VTSAKAVAPHVFVRTPMLPDALFQSSPEVRALDLDPGDDLRIRMRKGLNSVLRRCGTAPDMDIDPLFPATPCAKRRSYPPPEAVQTESSDTVPISSKRPDNLRMRLFQLPSATTPSGGRDLGRSGRPCLRRPWDAAGSPRRPCRPPGFQDGA
jgi:hypothetical protein